MFKTRTASYEVKNNEFVVITQLSTKKEIEIEISSFLNLLKKITPDFRNISTSLTYNTSCYHLHSNDNAINTYLAKGLDKKLITFLEKNSYDLPSSLISFENKLISEHEFNTLSIETNKQITEYQKMTLYDNFIMEAPYDATNTMGKEIS